MITAVWSPSCRRRLSTSRPDKPGNMMSRMTTSGDVRCHKRQRLSAVGAPLGLIPGSVEVGDEHLRHGLVVFHDEYASSHIRQPRQVGPDRRRFSRSTGSAVSDAKAFCVGSRPRNAFSVGP